MNIKDYLHLYLGCEVQYSNGLHYGIKRFDAIDDLGVRISGIEIWMLFEQVKPILRHISDMTEEEMNYCIETFGLHTGSFKMPPSDWVIGWEAFKPECFRYLLSKHFDLFGLIESGLAIDKTKIIK